MKTFWIRLLFTFAVISLPVAIPGLQAQNLGAVKQRMAQRLPAVDALKDRGAVGENNRGFLEARAALSGGESGTVSAENADRAEVYGALAQQTGSSSDQVGRARAKKIAETSKAGVWLQDESGNWRRK
jgi:uncharacterized protein YdbL (DUF1318 family)